MVSYRNDTIVAKKYYIGEYEYTDSVEAVKTKEVTFVSSPTGLIAANVKIVAQNTFYYILTDHLGSITQLLTDQGYAFANAHFTYDAWGRLRDIRNATDPYKLDYIIAKFNILDRGYCGHEHLLEHGIINMNGRIYDPVVGQFMQADNFIQTPEDYIGYNRYAYCRHNPFKYTDPSGESLMYYRPNFDPLAETANPIIYYSRSDAIRAEMDAEKAEELSSSGGGGDGGGGNATPTYDTEAVQISQGVNVDENGIIYLAGNIWEKAEAAYILEETYDATVTFDIETGKAEIVYNNSDKRMEGVRMAFDNMMAGLEKNGKAIIIAFGSENKFRNASANVGVVTIARRFIDREPNYIKDSDMYYSTANTAIGRFFGISDLPTRPQIMYHELVGHGTDFAQNYYSPFTKPDGTGWELDWQVRAVGRENTFLDAFGRKRRTSF